MRGQMFTYLAHHSHRHRLRSLVRRGRCPDLTGWLGRLLPVTGLSRARRHRAHCHGRDRAQYLHQDYAALRAKRHGAAPEK